MHKLIEAISAAADDSKGQTAGFDAGNILLQVERKQIPRVLGVDLDRERSLVYLLSRVPASALPVRYDLNGFRQLPRVEHRQGRAEVVVEELNSHRHLTAGEGADERVGHLCCKIYPVDVSQHVELAHLGVFGGGPSCETIGRLPLSAI